jgi:hypothetical protein
LLYTAKRIVVKIFFLNLVNEFVSKPISSPLEVTRCNTTWEARLNTLHVLRYLAKDIRYKEISLLKGELNVVLMYTDLEELQYFRKLYKCVSLKSIWKPRRSCPFFQYYICHISKEKCFSIFADFAAA